MVKFCIGNINPGNVSSTYMSSILNMMGDKSRPEHQMVAYLAKNDAGPYLDVARNYVVAQFMAQDADYLLFVDSDIEFRPGDVHALLDRAERTNRAVVGGWVI